MLKLNGFLPIDNVDLTLVSGSEFESFLSVKCEWNSKISQNVRNLDFSKKVGFFQNLYDFSQYRIVI